MDNILTLKNIFKTFSFDNTLHSVLSGISLTLQKGSLTCILGPSGCGKSTLLKIACSLESQDSGDVLFYGKKCIQPDSKRVMVFQEEQLYPWMTIAENVGFPQKVHGNSNWRREAETLLKKVQLSGWENRYPFQLSGGMKKRAAIARALLSSREILIMDEPFSSLDVNTRARLHQLVIDLWKDLGLTILFVTHIIDEALALGERIIVMDNTGSIISDLLVDESYPRDPLANSILTLSDNLKTRMKSEDP